MVITRDDVKRFKPHPEPYSLACKQLAVSPERTIIFEDSNTGATAALDAGCYTIGIADLFPFNKKTTNRLNIEARSFESLM